MREVKTAREVQTRESRRSVGTSPYTPRLTIAGSTGAWAGSEILALGVDQSRQTNLQNAAGEFYYMVGYDPLGEAPLG